MMPTAQELHCFLYLQEPSVMAYVQNTTIPNPTPTRAQSLKDLINKQEFQTLHWLLVALHLSAASPHLNKNVAASEYLMIMV